MLRCPVNDPSDETEADIEWEGLGLFDTMPEREPLKNVRVTEGVFVTDVVKDEVSVLVIQALVVTLEVEESEPDTVVVVDKVENGVGVPDPQALVVALEVNDFMPDTVGESVPLMVGEDVSNPEELKDPVMVEDKHKVGVPDTVDEILEEKDTLEDRDADGQ